MNKQRKLVGIFLSQPDDYYQSDLVTALLKRLFAMNYDAAIFMVSIKGMGMEVEERYCTGEANIYHMVNYDMLDAAMIAPDTLQIPGLADHLLAEIRQKCKGPKIAIDMQVDGFTCINADDAASVHVITDHLIEQHGFTKIAMLTGKKGHFHAENRARGYLESMAAHGLTEMQVFYGTFWFDDGERFIHEIVEHGKPKYEAVVCCSIQPAAGLCDALRARGLKIPDDIVVMSHDLAESVQYDISLSGTKLETAKAAIRAVDTIAEMFGDPVLPPPDMPIRLLLNESCGCRPPQCYRQPYQHMDMNFVSNFYSVYNFMLEQLISEERFEDFIEHTNTHTFMLGEIEMFAMCLCPDWAGRLNDRTGYRKTGYSDVMDVRLIRRGYTGDFNRQSFPLTEMLPWLGEERNHPAAVYFAPLHFYDRCFGYAAVSYGDKPIVYDRCFRAWIRNLNNALESFRLRHNLKIYSEIMRRNAGTDALTGIGNRLSFDEFGMNWVHGTKVTILVGDLNKLKYINDTFGHIEGDFALITTANAFRNVKALAQAGELAEAFRYGGDEFIFVMTGDTPSGDELIDRIFSHIEIVNRTAGKPYSVTVSIGASSGVIEDEKSFQSILGKADERMYAEKRGTRSFRKT